MCRGIDHGGRRCPSVDGAYRSAARYARLGREAAQGQGVGPSEGNVAVLDRPVFDVAEIKRIAEIIDVANTVQFATGDSLQRMRDAHRELADRFGSVEQAVTHIGDQIRQEAERRAGIDIEVERLALAGEVTLARERIDALRAEHKAATGRVFATKSTDPAYAEVRAEYERTRQAWSDATEADENAAAREGTTQRSQQALAALADSYREVLAEVRPMGGELTWNDRTSKQARAVFGDAARNYPSQWIEQAQNGPAPYGRIGTSRAHYARDGLRTVKKRVDSTTSAWVAQDDFAKFVSDHSDPTSGRALTAQERDRAMAAFKANPGDEVAVKVTQYDTRPISNLNPDTPPKGRGWTRMSGQGRDRWVRPRTRMSVAEIERGPEITTAARPVRVAGAHPAYATAVHELAHRFEHAVPQIASLEGEFLSRRAGPGSTPTTIYKGTREVGHADDLPLHYAGKVYLNRNGEDMGEHYELMSCGTQGLFGGDHGGLIGLHGDGTQFSRDDDYRSFVLGVLATAKPASISVNLSGN